MVDLAPAQRLARWLGFPLDQAAEGLLVRYAEWLREEAHPAGGIGPEELSRLSTRHLADSLALAVAWLGETPPSTILDVGSGVGLPGIPLAVLHWGSAVRLLDRSGRRCQLARRAIRVLGLDQVEVVQADVARWTEPAQAVVSRASLPPEALLPHLERLVAPGGYGVVAGSRRRRQTPTGYRSVDIPATVLDPAPRVLIMAPL